MDACKTLYALKLTDESQISKMFGKVHVMLVMSIIMYLVSLVLFIPYPWHANVFTWDKQVAALMLDFENILILWKATPVFI